MLLRAAFTETFGRPNYEDILPTAEFGYSLLKPAALDPAFPHTGSLEVGNPNLRPFHSTNLDLSFEYYTGGRGLIAVALYNKRIKNKHETFTEIRQNVVYAGVALETLEVETVVNGPGIDDYTGLEVSLYQPFTFLPAPFDGFGIDFNFTKTLSHEKIVISGRNASFVQTDFPQEYMNLTLFYERGRFSGRIAWNHTDANQQNAGNIPLQDRWVAERDQYDAQFRFRLNERFSLTASVLNITREGYQIYHLPNVMRHSELRDRTYRLGVDFIY
jgi:TonB-dependent receptor